MIKDINELKIMNTILSSNSFKYGWLTNITIGIPMRPLSKYIIEIITNIGFKKGSFINRPAPENPYNPHEVKINAIIIVTTVG